MLLRARPWPDSRTGRCSSSRPTRSRRAQRSNSLGPTRRGTAARLAGRDRYATAAAISAATFAPGVPVVYVATGLDFPDALAGPAGGGGPGAAARLLSLPP